MGRPRSLKRGATSRNSKPLTARPRCSPTCRPSMSEARLHWSTRMYLRSRSPQRASAPPWCGDREEAVRRRKGAATRANTHRTVRIRRSPGRDYGPLRGNTLRSGRSCRVPGWGTTHPRTSARRARLVFAQPLSGALPFGAASDDAWPTFLTRNLRRFARWVISCGTWRHQDLLLDPKERAGGGGSQDAQEGGRRLFRCRWRCSSSGTW